MSAWQIDAPPQTMGNDWCQKTVGLARLESEGKEHFTFYRRKTGKGQNYNMTISDGKGPRFGRGKNPGSGWRQIKTEIKGHRYKSPLGRETEKVRNGKKPLLDIDAGESVIKADTCKEKGSRRET